MRDLIGGVAAIVIGAGYLVMALGLRKSALADAVGPAGFPKMLAWAMIALGVALCLQSMLAMRATRSARANVAEVAEAPADQDLDAAVRSAGAAGWLRAAGLLALGVGYLMVVGTLGYIPSVALLVAATAFYLGAPPSWQLLVIAVVGALAYWTIFVRLLGIPLPAGPLAAYL